MESQERESEQLNTSLSRSNSFKATQQRHVPNKMNASFSELDSPSTDLLNHADSIKSDSISSRYIYVTNNGADTVAFHNYTPISHRRYITKLESNSDGNPFHSSPSSQQKLEQSANGKDNASLDMGSDYNSSKTLNDSDILDIYSDIGRMREKLAQAGSRRSHNL